MHQMDDDCFEQQYCNCGNIVFNGCVVSEDEIIELNPQITSLIVSNFNTIFVSGPSSIVIKQLSDVYIVQVNSSMFDLYCHKCKFGYRLIVGRDRCYSSPIEDCVISSSRNKGHLLKRPLSSFFPISLRRFIVEKAPDLSGKNITSAQSEYMPTFHVAKCLTEMDEDADYDLMFSSKQECIVGSFTDQWILTPEMAFG